MLFIETFFYIFSLAFIFLMFYTTVKTFIVFTKIPEHERKNFSVRVPFWGLIGLVASISYIFTYHAQN